MKQAYDINPSVGGPIMRDKLWFYASARWQTNQNYIAGLYSTRTRATRRSGRTWRTRAARRLLRDRAERHRRRD